MTLQDQPNARGFETMSITRNRITISSLQEAPGIRKTFNVNIEENVFVFLLRLYICIYLIVLTTTMMRHFIVVTKSKEDEMFENLSSAPIVYIYEDPQ